MARLRSALRRFAFACLLSQAASLSLVPATQWSGAAERLFECRCVHGDHVYCPMRHRIAPGSSLCLIGSPNDIDTAILASLFGTAGPPAGFRPPAPSDGEPAAFRTVRVRPLRRLAGPDPPPPRA